MVTYNRMRMVFLMALLVAVPAYAAPIDQPAQSKDARHQEMRARRDKRIQEVYAQLNLTEEQKSQLEANKLKHEVKMQSSRQEFKSYRQALNNELMQPKLNMEMIRRVQDEFKSAQAQMADSHLDSILEVRKILTPEQFALFVQLIEKDRPRGPRN